MEFISKKNDGERGWAQVLSEHPHSSQNPEWATRLRKPDSAVISGTNPEAGTEKLQMVLIDEGEFWIGQRPGDP